MKVRQATPEDVPSLVALFQELDRMQADWRVFTPRPGFYDEVGAKYHEAMNNAEAVVLVVVDDEGEVVGMAYGEARTPSRFSDERAHCAMRKRLGHELMAVEPIAPDGHE